MFSSIYLLFLSISQHFFIMQHRVQTIHNTKYELQIILNTDDDTIEFQFYSKINNEPAQAFSIFVPDELMEEDREKVHRNMYRHRKLIIKPLIPLIIYSQLQKKKQEYHYCPLLLSNITHSTKYNEKSTVKNDVVINKGIRYWRGVTEIGEVNIVLDPPNKEVHIKILDKVEGIKVGQVTISPTHWPIHQQPTHDLLPVFQSLINSSIWFVDWPNRILTNDDPLLLQMPLSSSLILPSLAYEELSPKESVFRHIFLTELIIHMVINQFGRSKWKHKKEREGYEQKEYKDEELESLRSWGYRMNEFRDIPVKRKKKGQNDGDSLEEEEEEETKEERKRATTKDKKEEKPKTKLGKMGLKIKERKEEDLCNFTFISGQEKSKINKMRYCLYQMTRETDQTQALMDFIRLVFHVEPTDILVGNYEEERKDEENDKKDKSMRTFLKQFKVKKDLKVCLGKYTEEFWFHRIINIGLRVLHQPYQLVYLRLPFSHLFWSIKFLYHRHKRAIFRKKQEKNKDRTITLYRGCSLSMKQIEDLKDSVNGYVQVEGFLSTSLDIDIADMFGINAGIEIKVPVTNLKGLFDNGFAHITNFSSNQIEKEVLINAFNVFKILGVSKKDRYKVYLEYGSIKSVEEKVLKKSDDLIDEEFKWKMNRQQIAWARMKLEQKEEEMSKKEHKKLMTLLPKEEEKLKKRKKKLCQWREREYQAALAKLSTWDKQLIVNTKHQQQYISVIENYGDLLFSVCEYRRGCVYERRRVKQLQLDRAVEGVAWRKSECIFYKQHRYRNKLSHCYESIGRTGESWMQMEKLYNAYVSINLPQTQQMYYGLLSDMRACCAVMLDKQEEEKKYKDRLMQILTKNQLQHTQEYKLMMERDERAKERERVQEEKEQKEMMKEGKVKKAEKKKIKQEHKRRKAKRKQQLKHMKQELKHIRLYTYGLYTSQYLQVLQKIIRMLNIWRMWKCGLKQGHRYMRIRSYAPHVEYRRKTCAVLVYMLEACLERKMKGEISAVCVRITQFTHTSIHNHMEYELVLQAIKCCLKLECWRAGKLPLFKLIQANIKCRLKQRHILLMMIFGYVLLLSSVCDHSVIDYFLSWINTLYQQQQYTHALTYKVRQYIVEYNEKYKNSSKSMWEERYKEQKDAYIIQFVRKSINNEAISLRKFVWQWEQRKAELIPWKHPFHRHQGNAKYISRGIGKYLGRESVGMAIQYLIQDKNMLYNMLNNEQSNQYVKRACSLSKLHMNGIGLQTIPSLLIFESNVTELLVVQIQMRLGIYEVILMTQHLTQENKQAVIKKISALENMLLIQGKDRIIEKFGLNMKKREVRRMKVMGRKWGQYIHSLKIRKYEASTAEMGLRESLQMGAQRLVTHFMKGQQEKKQLPQKWLPMQINFTTFLIISNFQQTEYDKIGAYKKLAIFLEFFVEYQSYNGLCYPIQEIKDMKSDFQLKNVERRLQAMGKLHMGNQQVWALDKAIRKLKEGPSEYELDKLQLLLKRKHIPPRSTPQERANYRKQLQQGQTLLREKGKK